MRCLYCVSWWKLGPVRSCAYETDVAGDWLGAIQYWHENADAVECYLCTSILYQKICYVNLEGIYACRISKWTLWPTMGHVLNFICIKWPCLKNVEITPNSSCIAANFTHIRIYIWCQRFRIKEWYAPNFILKYTKNSWNLILLT